MAGLLPRLLPKLRQGLTAHRSRRRCRRPHRCPRRESSERTRPGGARSRRPRGCGGSARGTARACTGGSAAYRPAAAHADQRADRRRAARRRVSASGPGLREGNVRSWPWSGSALVGGQAFGNRWIGVAAFLYAPLQLFVLFLRFRVEVLNLDPKQPAAGVAEGPLTLILGLGQFLVETAAPLLGVELEQGLSWRRVARRIVGRPGA